MDKKTENSPVVTVTETVISSGKKEKSHPFKSPETPFNKKLRREIISYAIVIAASLCRAVEVHVFLNPADFTPGGVTGIAMILQVITARAGIAGGSGINSGIWLFALNLPLILLAFKFLGKNFALKTMVSLAGTSLALILLEKIKFPIYDPKNDLARKILAAIAGGAVGGIGMAVVLKYGASSGGTDIIASLMQKRRAIAGIAWVIFALDATVIVASVFVYGNLEGIILAFILIFVSSKVCDSILSGFKSAIKFEIVTTDPENLAKEIMTKLRHGVTLIPAKGMYRGEQKALLICIIRKRQVTDLQKIITAWPNTFAYISACSDVIGLGFSRQE